MAGDELMRRLGVFMFAPPLGKHVFLLRIEERKFANFGELTRKAAFAYDWKRPCRHVLNPLSRTTVRMCKRTSYHGAKRALIGCALAHPNSRSTEGIRHGGKGASNHRRRRPF